jgi:SAM-dependent methyltransferase
MDLPADVCFGLSRLLMRAPATRTVDYGAYAQWRDASLTASWSHFSDASVAGRDVLDFGCGDGQLARFIADRKSPRSVIGIDLDRDAIALAREQSASRQGGSPLDFRVGGTDRMPLPDASVDTLLAFDCLEHVMSPRSILDEWFRVLRPGGRCLVEWYPYKGPWGPHMESLIPIPWAHVVFGERAMFRAAQRIYDLPEFVPRHWDLDDEGRKRPNKWRAWSSFDEQGYINKLDLASMRRLAREAGLAVVREELHGFGGPRWRRAIGKALMQVPLAGEYFVSFVVLELERPAAAR